MPAEEQILLAIGLMLTITTLHEFVHFSRNENNLPRRFTPPNSSRDYESGQYFEYAIDYNNIGLIEPSNAQEWLKYYRVKVKK